MARYQGTSPSSAPPCRSACKIPDYKFEPQDRRRSVTRTKKWQELGLVPSELCSDEQFIRRVYARPHRHAADARRRSRPSSPTRTPNKRDKLVDRLLESPEYSYYFANKWADILRVKRRNQPDRASGTFAFHDWIREAIASDKPYDQFVREILGRHRRRDARARRPCGTRNCRSPSSSSTTPPRCSSACAWPAPSAITIPTRSGARTITGAWPPSSAASAARTCRCPAVDQNQQAAASGHLQPADRQRHQQADQPARRDQAARRRADGDRPPTTIRGRSWSTGWSTRRTRSSPAPWPTATGRTSSAAASSIRSTTCASPTRRRNPELLDALAKDLVDNKFSLKHLIRTICKSRTYQLSCDAERVQQARQAEPTPATIRGACRPKCCSTRSAR